MSYNPSTPAKVGLEWWPGLQSVVSLDSITKWATESIVQTQVKTIDSLKVPILSKPQTGGVYAVEVYPNESAVQAAPVVSTATYAPSADVQRGRYTTQAGGTTNLYATLATPPVVGAAIPATYIKEPSGTSYGAGPSIYEARFPTGAVLAGKQIAAVRLKVWVQAAYAGFGLYVGIKIGTLAFESNQIQDFQGGFSNSPVYNSFSNGGGSGGVWLLVEMEWAFNPYTLKPWTVADVQAFASTNSFTVREPDYAHNPSYIWAAQLGVDYYTDSRLAVGVLDDTSDALTAGAYNTVPVLTPAGAAWAKLGTGRHLYVVRRVSNGGVITIPTLDSGVELAGIARGFTPTIDPATGQCTAMGTAKTFAFGLIQHESAGGDLVDSQVYAVQAEAKVFNGQTCRQELTAPASTTWGIVAAALKRNGAAGSLNIKVKRVSDNVQFGTTYTLSPDDWAALPSCGGGYRKISSAALPTPGTLVSGTRYYLEFSDTVDAGAGTAYWSVLGLDSLSNGQAFGFGGTTDAATMNGAARNTSQDLAVTLGQESAVPAPLVLDVSLQQQDLDGTCDVCGIGTIDFALLAWGSDSLGATFGKVIVQRSEDAEATWTTVCELISEGLIGFADYEGLRGVSCCYRVRVVTTDGIESDWSATGCVTPTVVGNEIMFTSNADPTLNVAYNYPAGLPVTDLNGAEQVFQKPYGLDNQYVFVPTEDRGVQFPIKLLVDADQTTTVRGLKAFTGLKAIAENTDIPYVCVLDAWGNRIYATVQVNVLTPEEDTRTRRADVIVTSVNVAETRLEAS